MKAYGILSVILCTSTLSFAQPKGIHLSWNGANGGTASTMSITWMDEKPVVGTMVYGTDSTNLNKKETAQGAYSGPLSNRVYKLTVKRLKPETYYYYKVGSAESGWSPVYKFRTGPAVGANKKIVVGVWSDTQNNQGNLNFEKTDSIVRQMSKQAYYFTLHNGDMVENGSVVKSWKDLLQVTMPINANTPFMSATGNHDVINDTADTNFQKPFAVYYDLFNLPNDQLNYSYDYGNTHFICINSGYAQGAEKVGKVLFGKYSSEYRWLEADLKKARKNKRITWIVLYSHYPVYSYGVSQVTTWQEHIKPLVDQYKVDLYLAGHRHVYERHMAVRGSERFEPIDKQLYERPQGTVYVTNGSCGGSLQGVGGHNLPTMVYTPKEKIHTYALMTIEGKTLKYNVFNLQGQQIDEFTITK